MEAVVIATATMVREVDQIENRFVELAAEDRPAEMLSGTPSTVLICTTAVRAVIDDGRSNLAKSRAADASPSTARASCAQRWCR